MSRRKLRIIAVVIMLAVGFAAVSATLNLTGLIGINNNQDDFKVIFTSAKLNNKKRNDFIDNTKTTINFETDTLTNLDEEAILDYEVTNTSRLYDANVEINCNIVDEEEHTIESNNIVMRYEPTSMTVEAGTTKSGKIKIRLFKVATEEQSIRIRCKLNANALERDALGKEYIEPFSRAGTMMAPKNSKDAPESIWQYRPFIKKVVFENQMIPHETTEDLTFDVSENQDKSVMAYLIPLSEDEKNIYFEEYIQGVTGMTLEEYKKYAIEQEGMTEEEFDLAIEDMKKNMYGGENSEYSFYTLYIQSDTGVKANPNSSYLFYKFEGLQEIAGLEKLDTGNVTNMSHMFEKCFSLFTIDLSNFDTSNVSDMSYMFSGEFDVQGNGFTTLDLSSFDTSSVTNMSRMFESCNNLANLNLSSFDTNNVTDMSFMFFGCDNLTELSLSNFDTSNVANMEKMFSECRKLSDINLNIFNTSNVTSMAGMFQNCHNLTELNLSSFDTKKVETMSGMFGSCRSLTSLDLSNFNTNSLKLIGDYYIYYGMFDGCNNLKYLDISNFDFSLVENTKNSFYGMPIDASVKVKDKAAQDWILALKSDDRPSAWNTKNVVIAS